MYEFWSVVKELTESVGGEHAWIADLVDVDQLHVHFVITAALYESEGTAREVICGVHDASFIVLASRVPGPALYGGSSGLV